MADPTPLSPAAQAVLDAYETTIGYRQGFAAVLRAAVDAYRKDSNGEGMVNFVEAIAAELEGAQ